MSRVALEALVGCIFSERLGDPKAVCDATTRYYATCGGLDPSDVLGLPDFVPRFTRLGVRHVLRAFYEAAHKGGEFLISGIVFPARIVRVFNVAGGNHPFDLSRPAGLKVAGIEAEPLNKYR